MEVNLALHPFEAMQYCLNLRNVRPAYGDRLRDEKNILNLVKCRPIQRFARRVVMQNDCRGRAAQANGANQSVQLVYVSVGKYEVCKFEGHVKGSLSETR